MLLLWGWHHAVAAGGAETPALGAETTASSVCTTTAPERPGPRRQAALFPCELRGGRAHVGYEHPLLAIYDVHDTYEVYQRHACVCLSPVCYEAAHVADMQDRGWSLAEMTLLFRDLRGDEENPDEADDGGNPPDTGGASSAAGK